VVENIKFILNLLNKAFYKVFINFRSRSERITFGIP